MVNILFYGNCQLIAVNQTLNLPKEFVFFEVQCFLTDITEKDFLDIIKKSDIIITQPIHNNYRNVTYLSTNFIINNMDINTKIIIIDSAYFNFYYFDLKYIYFNEELLQTPIDYHYDKMIECYKKNLSENYFIENFINNTEYKTKEELEIIAKNSLNELKNRFEHTKLSYNTNSTFFIHLYDFIKDNYKEKLLFYSMNHPTKYLIQYVCLEIIDCLQIPNTINYDIDTFQHLKCILYKCIQPQVNFDINEHPPLMLNKVTVEEITKIYYDSYKTINYS